MLRFKTSISVVITTYGASEWETMAWERAYPSVVNQIQEQDEIIIRHHPNLSIGPARNATAKAATGDFLIHLDADDQLADGYLDAMRHACSGEQHTVTLFQPAVSYIRKGWAAPPFVRPANDLRVDNYLVIGTMLKRTLFGEIGGFEDYRHGFEDWSLWAKAWKAGAYVVPVPQAVYRAFINPKSEHRTMWRNRREQVAMHLRVQDELFPGGVENWAR